MSEYSYFIVFVEGGTESKLFNSKEILWWEGIELAPSRQKLGLLGKMCFISRREANHIKPPNPPPVKENAIAVAQSPEAPSPDIDESSSEYSSSDDVGQDDYDSESSSNTAESDHGDANTVLKLKRFRLYHTKKRRRRGADRRT